MSNFRIAETNTFQKVKSKLDAKLYDKINNIVYPQLRQNPFFGKKTLKSLKENLKGFIVSVLVITACFI